MAPNPKAVRQLVDRFQRAVIAMTVFDQSGVKDEYADARLQLYRALHLPDPTPEGQERAWWEVD